MNELLFFFPKVFISTFCSTSNGNICHLYVSQENKKSWFRLGIRILLSFAFLQSGATRNRNLNLSSSISSLWGIANSAISSYRSTAKLPHSAHRGSGWFLVGKGTTFGWEIERIGVIYWWKPSKSTECFSEAGKIKFLLVLRHLVAVLFVYSVIILQIMLL